MSGVLMAWGPFRFEVGKTAYEEFQHRHGARWEKHPIIGRRPAGQYLGPGEEMVTLRGCIYTEYVPEGAAEMVADLVQAAGLPNVYTLISADGTIHGPFRLEKARRAGSFIAPDGQAQKLAYDLEFAAHDDGDGEIFSLWP